MTALFDLIVDSAPGEIRAALMRGETLVELLVLRRTDPPRRGDVYLGRVTTSSGGNTVRLETTAGASAGFV